jgi:hypothetical protein
MSALLVIIFCLGKKRIAYIKLTFAGLESDYGRDRHPGWW